MSAPQLKLFIDPQILQTIPPVLLREFLTHFKDALGEKHAILLRRDLPQAEMVASLQAFLNSPEARPALDELAAIEKGPDLNFALFNTPLDSVASAGSSPVQQALLVWLTKPFQLHYPPGTKADKTAPEPPAPSAAPQASARRSEAETATPCTPQSTLRTPHLDAHPEISDIPHAAPSAVVRQSGTKAELPTPHLEAPHFDDSPDSHFDLLPDDTLLPHLRLSVLFYEIEPALKRDFFDRFHMDLKAKFPNLPERMPDNDDFHDAVYQLLRRPQDLPQRMLDALRAIQELAAPTNLQLLRGLLAQAGIEAEPSTPSDQLALQFWLRCPFLPGGLEHLRSQLPEKFLQPPEPPTNGQNGDTPHSTLRTPHSTVPGDLAALACFPRYKISRLPPDVRESINCMLRQRIPYAQILSALGDHAKGLNKSNLSRWRKTGYLPWLAEQQRREDAQVQTQLLFDLVREKENGKIHEATQQIAALRISQVLAAFDPAALIQVLQQHPQSFVRLVQTLPHLSRGGMDCERLLLDLAERKALLDHEKNPQKRGISEEKLQYITQKLKLM